jgi:hypothetical protein
MDGGSATRGARGCLVERRGEEKKWSRVRVPGMPLTFIPPIFTADRQIKPFPI